MGRALAFVILLLPGVRAATAQDAFEIQVYDSETAAPGETGMEVHANHLGRRTAAAADRGFHVTFEPHLGVAGWAELGGYLQTAVQPGGGYEYAGAKLRFKARLPRKLADRVGLALNGELSALPRSYSEERFGAELRPVADARLGRAYLSVNPILAFDLEGRLAGRPQLEPAARVQVLLLEDRLGLGAEYYGAVGPLDAPLAATRQVHRVLGVLDVTRVTAGPMRLAVELGVGHDLAAGDGWIAKTIVGLERR